MEAPLSDIRVVDLSRILAGPYCTQTLADLGADVIKVEPPGGDDTRRFGPPFVEGESTYFLGVNRGKRSITVNLKAEAGKKVVHDLVAWADVLVENFRPGVADKLGVGYQAMSALNPRLVYASISGYGQRGVAPWSTKPGYDVVIQGVGGITSLTGAASGDPHKVGTSIADLVSGLNAVSGIMAALYRRERTGKGNWVDVSMQDGQLSLLSYHASAWLCAGHKPQRLGNAHPSICPYETFRASDGFFNLACGNDVQFERLCAALQREELLADERFNTNATRVQNHDALYEKLAPIFAGQTVEHWLEAIDAAGITCGPIYEVPEALEHPQVSARGMVVEVEHPTAGTVRSVGAPLGFEQASYASRPPPCLGEHSDEILTGLLGYDAAAVAELRATGAVGTPTES